MEETSEKTEKTESSEEALHHIYHSSVFQRTIADKEAKVNQSSGPPEITNKASRTGFSEQSDYNIKHIYLSSYMRLHI